MCHYQNVRIRLIVKGVDILVSYHHNANTGQWGSSWTGTETYHYPSSTNGQALARKVHPAIVGAMGLRDRGIKTANFHILRESNMPAILVEGGFMDSTIDIVKMRNNTVLDRTGNALADAIASHVGLKKKSDDTRWRLQTGLFNDARSFADAIERLSNRYSWNLHEQATTTELNPRYRIVTGLFTGKNVAEYHAEQVREEFGWNIHVVEG